MNGKTASSWEWNNGPVGRLIKTTYITLRRELEKQLKPTGLSHTQWSALGTISHFPGVTSSELELILMIERPSVTSLINGLVNKKLVVRRDHPGDARSKQIFLTEAGQQLADETQHYAQIVEDRVKEGMSPEEFETLKALLVKTVGIFGGK
ncbi:MarR family winged helix-turn-helix transcriptional regulator [Paenibacillus allorhizosphaerae]|uniref:Transcriptional regulator SlyA n=1 Tax=Paenibacillus allorhizosphaerae TaxID=2849866 RepID=A0ABM8VEW2_9BACL|nr:MarR family winged helix-turn-helix transcriptional regulator [Paenibacillus allorhizosphaerae]CAG7630496.1 Transcriptional regulator SlyA [Paenibacillus allorhizosphaerae]